MTIKNNFDGLRLIGAMLVLLSHQFALSGWAEPQVLQNQTFGSLGVLIFFSISGFLVAGSWQRDPSLWRFALRRFLRIWPGLAVCVVLLVAMAVLWQSDRVAPQGALKFLGNLVVPVFDWPFFKTNAYQLMNGSLWTIKYEMVCYVVFALLAVGAFGRSVAVTAVATVLFVGGYWWFGRPYAGGPAPWWTFLCFFEAFFCVGVLASGASRLLEPRATAVMLLLGALAAVAGQTFIAMVLVIPLLVLQVGVRSWPLLRDMGRWGDLSYGIYLYAWPVQQVGAYFLPSDTSLLSRLLLSTTASAMLAFLSWHLVEKQALKFKPSTPRV